MSEWISVKDRLPDAGEMVLVNVERYSPSVSVGARYCEKWGLLCNIGTINDIDYGSTPTHWMPLPAPPESKLTVREALKDAIEVLGLMKNYPLASKDLPSLLPRLRAALETE